MSFSGGKDSTILHHLLDMALPNNRIPRVFIDTGIEFNMIREFVMGLAKDDDRFVILKPTRPIIQTLEKYGYPFKSKQHSHNLAVYQNNMKETKSIRTYLYDEPTTNGKHTMFTCPKELRYQFTPEFKIKCSDKCCLKLKKEPAHKWQKANNRTITITGMRKSEGGNRIQLNNCILTDSKGQVQKFHPLVKVDDEWENWFIERERERVALAPLYCQPYNFKRTGCKGCPFALDLQEQLEIMERYLPNERKQCEMIWKPIYAEYRRLGYRLKKVEKVRLF